MKQSDCVHVKLALRVSSMVQFAHPTIWRMEPRKTVDFTLLSQTLCGYRRDRGLNLRDASKEAGISVSTLSRLERGDARPDADTVRRLVDWMGIGLERVLVVTKAASKAPRGQAQQMAQTLAQVEVHLRADPNLDPAAARALADILRSAYKTIAGPK